MYSKYSLNGMITAPHHLAAEAGADILRDGGSAVEAMVAAAATIAVVYPHMNSIGGDGFWLIKEPGKPVRAIEACGPAAQNADISFYKELGHDVIPTRGALAALTVAGTVSGWQKALEINGSKLPISALLSQAIAHAKDGIVITKGQAELTRKKWSGLKNIDGFEETCTPNGLDTLQEGRVLKQSDFARSLEHLAEAGLDDFYRGDLARTFAKELTNAGSPLQLSDLEAYQAKEVDPLRGQFECGDVFNMPPPTQGVSSIMITGLFEKLGIRDAETFAHHHGLIETVKQAFLLRNAYVEDPDFMSANPQDWLTTDFLNKCTDNIDMERALPWPHIAKDGDTVWMGCADKNGCVVSFIQSTYWEYGSGFIPKGTGILWQNRGSSFSLNGNEVNALKPYKRPFHTLIPGLALLKDGRTLAYGTMGGEGQPQTQAQIFSRYVTMGQSLQQSISAPRWLLGRTWGEETTTLKLEDAFDEKLIDQLKFAGHDVEIMPNWNSTMGHAGGVCINSDGVFEGGFDPRSDGAAIGL